MHAPPLPYQNRARRWKNRERQGDEEENREREEEANRQREGEEETNLTKNAASYMVYGFVSALQYWAYEAVLDGCKDWVKPLEPVVPRMLGWTTIKALSIEKVESMLNMPKVST